MKKLEEQLFVSSVTVETQEKNGDFVVVEDLTIKDFPVRIKERSELVVIESISEHGQYSYRAPSSGAQRCLSSRDFLSNKEEVAREIEEVKNWVIEQFANEVQALHDFSKKESLGKFAEIRMLSALTESLLKFSQSNPSELVTIDSELCPEMNTERSENKPSVKRPRSPNSAMG